MLTSAIALAALAASAIPSALGQATYCDGIGFCAIGGVDADGEVIVTIQSSATGWVAFGTGTRMAGASIYAGWRNSNGGITFSPRQATGNALPPVSNEGIARLVATPAGIARPSWANIMYTFKRPVSGINRMASGSYIYAYSDVPPTNPNSPSSSFTKHDDHNSFRLDLSKLISPAATSTKAVTTTAASAASATAGPAAPASTTVPAVPAVSTTAAPAVPASTTVVPVVVASTTTASAAAAVVITTTVAPVVVVPGAMTTVAAVYGQPSAAPSPSPSGGASIYGTGDLPAGETYTKHQQPGADDEPIYSGAAAMAASFVSVAAALLAPLAFF